MLFFMDVITLLSVSFFGATIGIGFINLIRKHEKRNSFVKFISDSLTAVFLSVATLLLPLVILFALLIGCAGYSLLNEDCKKCSSVELVQRENLLSGKESGTQKLHMRQYN